MANERETILFDRACSLIKNWQFDCAASFNQSRPLTDAERSMLAHHIKRQVHHAEYETVRVLQMCMYACSVALSLEKDSNQTHDELREEYFHVKMLREAVEEAKKAGF